MMDVHGGNKNSAAIEVEDDHEQPDLTCGKCGFKARKLEELNQHNQAKHQEVRVELHLSDMIKHPLSCSKWLKNVRQRKMTNTRLGSIIFAGSAINIFSFSRNQADELRKFHK